VLVAAAALAARAVAPATGRDREGAMAA
jgi:hypothetical protein